MIIARWSIIFPGVVSRLQGLMCSTAERQIERGHLLRRFHYFAFVIEKLVITDGFGELRAYFRVSLLIEPMDIIGADLEHAADSDGAVLQLLIDPIINMARQQSVRAPGEDNHQERER